MGWPGRKPPQSWVFTPESPGETAQGWALHATRRRKIHENETRVLDRRRYWFGSLAAAFAAVAGTSAFAAWQTDSSKSTVWAVVTAIVGIGAAVLANALAFLDFGGRAETHRRAAVAYKDILREFEEAFGLNENGSPSIDRGTLSTLKSQLSEVDRAAPTVPVKRGSKIEQQDYGFATTAMELASARARLKADVARADAESKVLTASGEVIGEVIEVWNDRRDPALSISRVLVKPGFTTELHALDVDKRYVIIEGCGNARIGSLEATDVAVGDVVAIPARSQRQITNTNKGDGKNLVFYRIRSPRLNRAGAVQ